MKDLKEKEAPLIFRRLTLEINTSLQMCIRDSNYYIDNKGKIMPIPNSSAHVAVVTGYVDRDFAVKDIDKAKTLISNKYSVSEYIAYFQSFTNTYADAGYLRLSLIHI